MSANIEYQLAHENQTQVPALIASGAICLSAAYTFVFLRFTSRRLSKTPIKADDWAIVLGLVSTLCVKFFSSKRLADRLSKKGVYDYVHRHNFLVDMVWARPSCCLIERPCSICKGSCFNDFQQISSNHQFLVVDCCRRSSDIQSSCRCDKELNTPSIRAHIPLKTVQCSFMVCRRICAFL